MIIINYFRLFLFLKSIILIILEKNIKYLRQKKGLTQKEIAQHLKVRANTYSCYECGKTEPNTENIVRLARYFEVSIDDLLETDLSKSVVKDDTEKIITRYNNEEQSFSNAIVPIKARAGYFSTLFQDEVKQVKYLKLPFFNSIGEKRTFEVEGNSMIPVFQSGDFVSCLSVDSPNKIISGKYYVVISKQDGFLIKKVINDKERQHYILISENSENPTTIRHWSEVDEMWLVKYKITSHMK